MVAHEPVKRWIQRCVAVSLLGLGAVTMVMHWIRGVHLATVPVAAKPSDSALVLNPRDDLALTSAPLSDREREMLAGEYAVLLSTSREPFSIVLREGALWMEPRQSEPSVLVELGREPAWRSPGSSRQGETYLVLLGLGISPGYRLTLDVDGARVSGGVLQDGRGRYPVRRTGDAPRPEPR